MALPIKHNALMTKQILTYKTQHYDFNNNSHH